MTVLEIYNQTIKPLPAAERLRLATLILNGISPQSVVDYSEQWSEEDFQDFSKGSWDHIDKALEESEGA